MNIMWIRCCCLTAWLLTIAWCVPAHAHHSFVATYISSQEIEIEGVVVQFQFRNPHSFIHVLVSDSAGNAQRWAVECAGTASLMRNNVSSKTLKPGDRVIITGNPGRNPDEYRLLLRSITRPSDGWKWDSWVE